MSNDELKRIRAKINTLEGKQRDHRKEQKDHRKKTEKDAKRTFVSLVVGGISFFIACVSLYFSYNAEDHSKRILNQETIFVGMTPFHVNDKKDLQEKYNWYFRPVNKRFKDQFSKGKIPYQVEVAISDDYIDVLKGVSQDDNIQMAFVSVALYDYCISRKDSLKEIGIFLDSISHIGYKRMGNDSTYRSHIIWNEKTDSAKKILLGPKLSISTNLIPSYYYSKVSSMDIDTSRTYSRTAMIDSILKKESVWCCALSNEDLARIPSDKRAQLRDSIIMDIEIPYDVVLVNKKWYSEKKQDVSNNIFTKKLCDLSIIEKAFSIDSMKRRSLAENEIWIEFLPKEDSDKLSEFPGKIEEFRLKIDSLHLCIPLQSIIYTKY